MGAFWTIRPMTACWPQAVALDVPIYIHPHLAPEAVRNAYYSAALSLAPGGVLEAAGWGWHSETALHVLRLVLAGTLDQHPKLKLIIGHMGEMLPMMLARADEVFANRHRPSAAPDWPDHPGSGLDHDQRHLQRAALPSGTADLRHRPHHLLGRLSLCTECQGQGFPRPYSPVSRRIWRSSLGRMRRCLLRLG